MDIFVDEKIRNRGLFFLLKATLKNTFSRVSRCFFRPIDNPFSEKMIESAYENTEHEKVSDIFFEAFSGNRHT